ncbi:hypothetical protein HOC80_02450 [archaeon]|jgi:hypothetical protein|nr:hypothetical protein [archaeon]MBT4416940.1 hypothetical protein [archaeon]
MIDLDLPVYTKRQIDRESLVEVNAPVEIVTRMGKREVRRAVYAVGKTANGGILFGNRQCVVIDGVQYVVNNHRREWQYEIDKQNVIVFSPAEAHFLEPNGGVVDFDLVGTDIGLEKFRDLHEILEVDKQGRLDQDNLFRDLGYCVGMTKTDRLRIAFRGVVMRDNRFRVRQVGKVIKDRKRGERLVKGDHDVIKTYQRATVLDHRVLGRV